MPRPSQPVQRDLLLALDSRPRSCVIKIDDVDVESVCPMRRFSKGQPCITCSALPTAACMVSGAASGNGVAAAINRRPPETPAPSATLTATWAVSRVTCPGRLFGRDCCVQARGVEEAAENTPSTFSHDTHNACTARA